MTATDADGRPRSYLSNEETFTLLKKPETNHLLLPVVDDFAGRKAI